MKTTKKRYVSLATCAVCGFTVAAIASTAHAVGTVGTRTPSMAAGDFDDDGRLDGVFGYPSSNSSEGTVSVVYGSEVIEVWNRDSPGVLSYDADYNFLGDSVAVGDFDGDGYDDLAIGVPGDDDSSSGTNVGSISVLYGSSGGLTGKGDQLFTQDSPGIANLEESHDYYGEVLQSGDFDCDGYDDLAIGIPQENLNAGVNAGAVNVIYGGPGGLTTVDDWFHQNTSGVAGSVAASDFFGGSLLAANINGDTFGGNACDDLVVGVPGEKVVNSSKAGAMHMFPGHNSGLRISSARYVSQANRTVDGYPEPFDNFSGWLYGATTVPGAYADLAVRVPGDACTAGGMALQLFDGSSTGLSGANNDLVCVDVVGELEMLADAFTTCILDPGVCDCSEEFRVAVDQTNLPAMAREPWMCTVKLQAASDLCFEVPAQGAPSTSPLAADCIEASEEAWDGCDYGTVEGEL